MERDSAKQTRSTRNGFKEIRKRDNIDMLETLQGEKMLVPGDNKVSLDLHSTFDDAIVRLISHEMQMRLSLYDGCDFGNSL